MKKLMFLMMAAALVTGLYGVEITVAGKSGDLANGATYDGSAKPTSSDTIAFNSSKCNKGTYTLSEDLTAGNIYLSSNIQTFDFTDGNHKLSLTTPVSYEGPKTLFAYSYGRGTSCITFKGGVWDCAPNGTSNRFSFVNLGMPTDYYTFVLTNSCKITGIGGSDLFRRISNSRVLIRDGSEISGFGMSFCSQSSVYGTNDVMEISGGSKVKLNGLSNGSGGFYGGSSTNDAVGANYLIVKGSGSSFTTGDQGFMGFGESSGYGGFGLRVQDGATAYAGYPAFSRGTKGCSIEVTGGASFTAGCFDWYGSECWTFVSNANLTVKWPRFSLGSVNGSSVGHHNRMTIAGSSASFSNAAWDTDILGPYAHDNVFSLENGATVTLNRAMTEGKSTNGTFRVSGANAHFNLLNSTTVSGSNALTFGGAYAVSNHLEVLDGGMLSASVVLLNGTGQELVISNGTVRAGGWCDVEKTKEGYTVWLCRDSGSSGARLVMRGNCPKIVDPIDNGYVRTLIIGGNSTLRFEIPKDGWVKDHVAIEVGKIYPVSFKKENKLEIDCADWALNPEATERELVLVRQSVSVQEEIVNWLSGLSLDLPSNVKCIVRGKDIILKKRLVGKGMVLFVR